VHPHASTVTDLCAHAAAIVVMLGIGAGLARVRARTQ
jgi:hypothetical protein